MLKMAFLLLGHAFRARHGQTSYWAREGKGVYFGFYVQCPLVYWRCDMINVCMCALLWRAKKGHPTLIRY